MTLKLLVVMLVSAAALRASAETTKDGWFFTFTKEDAHRVALYLNDGDRAAVEELRAQKRCFGLKPGVEVKIVETSGGLVKFRMKGSTVEFWTVIEAINP